ncbi:hypothetical protein EMIHUDRAFT_222705 [Emiliania huxleyi CCMP1516]|uniref:Thioredoxin domain-containing protein n=2 Tax=Emiliania huxleyi TaxID=2903 RepID=A0A0D3KXV0_EMIH1|nr:hypothetical protein EMIHUDRAFT_222705 [Emiliania huxleyi CCMP1516]EOD40585.1 hypothetical protein EMIHUDRAFT_222705 [Emiliania huxleyi CCMP1516]|eukprot:XP_005793014.1 hypothetical protein EMIHUDRAFT_222705 [Emiliania huxleyi CCMP1516]
MARRLQRIVLSLAAATTLGDEPHTSQPSSLAAIDMAATKELVMKNEKVVLLLHTRGCHRAESFSPTLASVAERVPGLEFARLSLEPDATDTGGGFAKGVEAGRPMLKAFFRNAPPGKRVLEYAGPPNEAAVLEWARAVDAWDGSDALADGWEVGKAPAEASGGSPCVASGGALLVERRNFSQRGRYFAPFFTRMMMAGGAWAPRKLLDRLRG